MCCKPLHSSGVLCKCTRPIPKIDLCQKLYTPCRKFNIECLLGVLVGFNSLRREKPIQRQSRKARRSQRTRKLQFRTKGESLSKALCWSRRIKRKRVVFQFPTSGNVSLDGKARISGWLGRHVSIPYERERIFRPKSKTQNPPASGRVSIPYERERIFRQYLLIPD